MTWANGWGHAHLRVKKALAMRAPRNEERKDDEGKEEDKQEDKKEADEGAASASDIEDIVAETQVDNEGTSAPWTPCVTMASGQLLPLTMTWCLETGSEMPTEHFKLPKQLQV